MNLSKSLAIASLFLAACTSIDVPRQLGAAPKDSKGAFSHKDFDEVLRKVVDARGRVDYESLRLDHRQLDRYMSTIAATSPTNDRSLFPTRWHSMAFWINAFNACVIYAVVDKGITDSVGDDAFKRTKFFSLTKYVLGGESMSLNTMEDDELRARYADPRVHFALNWGAIGSPRLRAEAYSGDTLESVLDDCAKEFCNDTRNVKLSTTFLQLSKLFDTYSADFIEYATAKKIFNPTVRDAINFWRPEGSKLPTKGENTYFDFDWALNSQRK